MVTINGQKVQVHTKSDGTKINKATGQVISTAAGTPGFVSSKTINSATKPNNQSLTTFSSDKSTDIANNNVTLDEYSNKGITTDPNTGLASTSSGTTYEPLKPVEADTQTEDDAINSYYDSLQKTLDKNTQYQIDNAKNRFDQLRADQIRVNAQQEKQTQNALLMGGATGQGSSAQYAPISSVGIVQSQMSYGLKQIANLDAQENDLIAQAKQAQTDGNFRIVEAKLADVKEKRKEKMDAATKLNETIQKANEKALEQQEIMVKDGAITELFSQGITDVPTILSTLRDNGIFATSKEISETLKNTGLEDINKLMYEASKNGAPLSVVQKIGQSRSLAQATIAAGAYTGDVLDREYKKAQISKIYSDIAEAKIKNENDKLVNPDDIIAYAQQYAADGKIPSGIPKGSFGVISQVAKELPKQKGQIIDSSTGVAPTGDTTLSNAMASLSSVVDLAKQLKELDEKRVGGIISGTTGKIFGSKDQSRYLDLRSQIVDLLSRARSGAALTPSEEARYGDMLPGRYSESLGLGVDSKVKIDNFINNITSDLDNKARSKGWSIYGISTVDTPAGIKKVGETVTLPNGVSGRINADGTVTLLQ